jgi:Leucine-rich repeat (LRR) protein
LQVIVLDKLLPGLQELHLCGNSITSLQWEQGEGSSDTAQSGQSFKQLQVLSLEDNKIAQWEEVMQLAWLASLTSLSLSDNPLSSIHYPASTQGAASASGTTASEQQQPVAFAALQKLYLASCQLSSWSDVDALHHFPALRELRLTGNPILATAKGGGRYEVGDASSALCLHLHLPCTACCVSCISCKHSQGTIH